MKIIHLEHCMGNAWSWIDANESLQDAFPRLCESQGQGKGYTWPMHAVRSALCWLWLRWHQDNDLPAIRRALASVISRAIEADHTPGACQFGREEHDNFLIQLAVLLGIEDLLATVCDAVLEADVGSNEYQYLQAWTGVLKFRIPREEDRVQEQYEIMRKFKPNRIFLWPLDSLVKPFVARNYRDFNRALKRSCERQWNWARKERALLQAEDGTQVLDVAGKHSYFLWPWVEAAFAKLALADGADITYDSVWLPLALLRDG